MLSVRQHHTNMKQPEKITAAKVSTAKRVIAENEAFRRFYNQMLQDQRFSLVVGAGCSVACGVPDFRTLKKLLSCALSGDPRRKNGVAVDEVEDKEFQRLWKNTGQKLRYTTLCNWLLPRPASLEPYYPLASLIKGGYIKTVVTYNIDGYLDLALHSIGFDDFLTLVNGRDHPDYIRAMLADEGSTKIFKTHGDHKYKVYALSESEVLDFGERCRDVLVSLLGQKLLVIGYSASDTDFIRSLPLSADGEEIWFANPAEPPAYLKAVMERRHSEGNWIAIDFESLTRTLYYALYEVQSERLTPTRVRTPAAKASRVSSDLIVQNALGIHARPAALIIKTASKYDSDLWIECKGLVVSGKSIMGIIMLHVNRGDRLTVTAEGVDAQALVKALRDLFDSKFFEE